MTYFTEYPIFMKYNNYIGALLFMSFVSYEQI